MYCCIWVAKGLFSRYKRMGADLAGRVAGSLQHTMTPGRGLAALCAAFTAGLTLTLVVVDSTSDSADSQRITTDGGEADPATETAAGDAEEAPTVVALADVADRTLLRVPGSSPEPTANEPAATQPSAAPSTGPNGAETDDDQAGDPEVEKQTVTVEGSASTPATPSSQNNSAPSASSSSPSSATPPTRGSADDSSSTSPSASRPSSTSGPTTTRRPTTRPPSTTAAPTTTRPPTTTAPPTTAAPPTTNRSGGGSGEFESIRNRDPLFDRYANVPSNQLSIDALTIPASPHDNGAHPHGNFRMACAYSHFAYDDPIVFPGQPGRSHLHMFFGNTAVDANTTTNSLVNSGGSSCNGFELNRSGYWTPALHDGKGNLVVPDQIILYYKTTMPSQTVAMPQGLKMVVGNTTSESFTANQRLGWSCGASGTSYNKSNRIPNNCGNDPINAYVQFPNCWDGRNLDSSDHISHMYFANDNQQCPSSHPVRLPQITILLYFPPGNTSGWYLSSDRSGGFNTGPGATLHADWFGGWNDDAMDLWINGCIRASRNCSYGQTGTSRMFAKLNNLQNYPGNNFLPMP